MVIVVAGLVAACHGPPQPRSVFYFMEDGLAREGALARCNQDRDATLVDVECRNARRASAAIALEEENARSGALALQSQRKLVALRDRAALRAQAESDAAAAARAAAASEYELRWRDPKSPQDGALPQDVAAKEVPAFGAPVGPVLSSLSEPLFQVSAEPQAVQELAESEIAAATPLANDLTPANELTIVPPALDLEELATIPRPFRRLAEDASVPQ
jgi:hypothetical protein